MASDGDSEDEALENLEFEYNSDAEDEIDESILDAIEGDLAAEEAASEEETPDDDSDSGSDDSDSDEDDRPARPPPPPPPIQTQVPHIEVESLPQSAIHTAAPSIPAPPPVPFGHGVSSPSQSPIKTPTPPPHALSPAALRKSKLFGSIRWPRSFTVEAIAAIPHPVPTHCLASSACMTHLLTGSDDGYIRDYDVFPSVNGKIYLTAPQRHHCGVMEGQMKAVPIRCWWENPADMRGHNAPLEDPLLCAPYSMLMHSDALWSLAGTEQGHINLFTVRHDPGQLCYVMYGHRGPVSSLSMQYDEKGFFSAGWDGEALQWDLNTGQIVRNFTSHGAQLAAVAVRPLPGDFVGIPWVGQPRPPPTAVLPPNGIKQEEMQMTGMRNQSGTEVKREREEDAESSASFDPLFDDEPDSDAPPTQPPPQAQAAYPTTPVVPQQPQRPAVAPKNAPPILDPTSYAAFSPDVLMTASIDGQVILWDRRVHSPGRGVGRLWMGEKTPPWCMSACWSADGGQIYAGRRNGTVDVWDVRQTGQAHMGTPRVLKTLRNPLSSGVVSCVVAFPDGKHIACASNDNIRLWNVAEAGEPDSFGKMKSGVQFKIIPGHHGGFISQMLVDPAARFLVSASSNRGWHGESTRTVFVHEVKTIW